MPPFISFTLGISRNFLFLYFACFCLCNFRQRFRFSWFAGNSFHLALQRQASSKKPNHVGACHKHQMLKKRKISAWYCSDRLSWMRIPHVFRESIFDTQNESYNSTLVYQWRFGIFSPDTRNPNHCFAGAAFTAAALSIHQSFWIQMYAVFACSLACFVNKWIGDVCARTLNGTCCANRAERSRCAY